MKKIKLKINGMNCSSCAMNIDFDLEDLDGIKFSKTNYAKEECEVLFDERSIKIDQILKTVGITGYSAQVMDE